MQAERARKNGRTAREDAALSMPAASETDCSLACNASGDSTWPSAPIFFPISRRGNPFGHLHIVEDTSMALFHEYKGCAVSKTLAEQACPCPGDSQLIQELTSFLKQEKLKRKKS
jgi:hypothetical protein